MNVLLNEARLSRPIYADHADLLLNHCRAPGDACTGVISTLNETLRLILALSVGSAASSGLLVATGLRMRRLASMPAASSHAATASTRRCASAAFVSSAPLGSVRPV